MYQDGYDSQYYGNAPAPPYKAVPPTKTQYVRYVPVGEVESHSMIVGYLFWIIGFTGAHRFYYGKPLTGVLWFFTGGLFGIGWLVDLFLIPSMDSEAKRDFQPGPTDYSISWALLVFLGWFGAHRFYQGRIITGVIFLLTGGLFGFGIVYDVLTMNEQIHERNENAIKRMQMSPHYPAMAIF